MELKIALAGNPNCGKTTLFNALTGSNQYVGNWPGVTVEKKEGKLKKQPDITITDLPGIYSLSPYTLEEVVARNYLVDEAPDAILNIVDGTNLERNLYLTTQLMELGIPVVVAINMMDIVNKNGDKINIEELSRGLSCPVVDISALKGDGIQDAADLAIEAAKGGKRIPTHIFSGTVEHAIAHIEEVAVHGMPEERQRWYAIKIFERDAKVLSQLELDESKLAHIEKDIAAVERELDDDAEAVITNERYVYIEKLMKVCYKKKDLSRITLSDKIDRIVTNRILALPIFAVVMFFVYAIAMGSYPFSIGTIGTDWANDVLFGEIVPSFFNSFLLDGAGDPIIAPWLYGLIMEGIIGGVGAVLGFVPQLMVLYLLLAIIEDCGYMSRVAFIMDKIFRKFGLSGKSFIPMLVATGCGVTGIMSSRTIDQDRDRKMTIITTGFVPCSAKMPIVGLFAGAIFGNSALVATSAFFIGIGAVVISGIILKKFKAFAGDPAPFVMELPIYHAPSPTGVLRATWERGWSFIKRAGTVILLSTVILWFLQGYGFTDGRFGAVDDNNHSLLALLGNAIAWLFYPIGWMGDMAWKATVATLTGLIAKEEVVATFGTLYGVEVGETGEEIWNYVRNDFSALSAYSFMIFNLLCAPCFGAIGAIRREMNNWRWTAFTITYMCVFAYVISLIVYQLGGLITGETAFGIFTVVSLIFLAALVYLLVRKNKYNKTNKL
ncbi:MAG: ferrous iron transport protein B [Ruminococcaceae bacterium]|nr:ferrous iron transport protein B [Oscillospiraceae bacterium]